MLIDTHCHIHDRDTYDFMLSRQQISRKLLAKDPSIPHEASDFTPEKILDRAHENGIEKMITIGTSHENSLEARAFAEKHAGVFWSYGIHPDEAESYKEIGLVGEPVAIGEVGLDYREGEGTRAAQIKLFEQMLELAIKNDLPLIFHVRDAFDDFWPIVDNAGVKRAVVHSFSDNEENLKKALNHNFYIGVNGLATFADLPLPPLEKTLLETDAPFLAPVPVRGRVNEPAYIKNIAEFLVEKHKKPAVEIANITTKNAEELFKI